MICRKKTAVEFKQWEKVCVLIDHFGGIITGKLQEGTFDLHMNQNVLMILQRRFK